MTLTQTITPALIALSFFGIAALPAHAVIGGSGLPSQSGGNEMTAWIQANEFDLTTPTVLGNVEFWDLENTGAYHGSIAWDIYANNAGTPGTLLASGDALDVTRAATGASGSGLTEYSDAFSLGAVPLATGDYWLGLHNGPLTTTSRAGFYWEDAAPSTGLLTGEQKYLAAGGFSSNGSDHAFTLMAAAPLSPAIAAVPEPSAFALIGLGLLPLAVVARRRLMQPG